MLPAADACSPHLTTWLLSESICSSETSRSAVEGTPSSSICEANDTHSLRNRQNVQQLWIGSLQRPTLTSSLVFFRATSLPVFLSLALYTLP